ncbi:MAG: hypothetical protein L6Q54_15375 [Leptospiraceae bacterium]|nr:hypothetical protein [Leptospiraceae bacterium]MCK6382615.1 hypothetical protein [Leptospiraceae bacterium]NUM42782.1 hypothetical protein [Leptospiraceae bacterium]
MKFGNYTLKQLISVFVSGIVGLASSKVITDKTGNVIKDNKIRKLLIPAGIVAIAIYLLKNKKFVQESIGLATGAVIVLAGAVLDYVDKDNVKTQFLGLSGDNNIDEIEIPLNNLQEVLDFATASQQLQGELFGNGYTEIKDSILEEPLLITDNSVIEDGIVIPEDDIDSLYGDLYSEEDDSIFIEAV